MVIPLKPDINEERVAAAVPLWLKEELQSFCDKNHVTESQALRHILSVFFEGSSEKSIENSGNGHAEAEVLPEVKS